MLQDDIGAAHGDIYPQLLEDGLVLGVPDAGYGAADIELLLSHLAGDQVILVVAGNGDEDIRPAGAYLVQGGRLAAVAVDADAAHLVVDYLAVAGFLLHDGHFVPLVEQGFGQVVAYPAAPDDYDIHIYPFSPPASLLVCR